MRFAAAVSDQIGFRSVCAAYENWKRFNVMRPTQSQPAQSNRETITFRLLGQVGATDFFTWMERHAGKLGVEFDMIEALPHRVSIRARGAEEMVDAFALACSLGPRSVCVEMLEFTGTSSNAPRDEKSGIPQKTT